MKRRIFLRLIRTLTEGPVLPKTKAVVKVCFNTDTDGKWVYDINKPNQWLPMCMFGPFKDENAAYLWMEKVFVDDTDVYDMHVVDVVTHLRSLNDPIAALPLINF